MPTYLSPGVYVEETEAGTRPPTDVAALVVGGSPVSAPESGPAPVRVAPADPPRVVQRAPVRGLTGARALVPQLTSPAPIEPARTGRRTGSRPVRVQRPTWAPPSSSTSRSGETVQQHRDGVSPPAGHPAPPAGRARTFLQRAFPAREQAEAPPRPAVQRKPASTPTAAHSAPPDTQTRAAVETGPDHAASAAHPAPAARALQRTGVSRKPVGALRPRAEKPSTAHPAPPTSRVRAFLQRVVPNREPTDASPATSASSSGNAVRRPPASTPSAAHSAPPDTQTRAAVETGPDHAAPAAHPAPAARALQRTGASRKPVGALRPHTETPNAVNSTPAGFSGSESPLVSSSQRVWLNSDTAARSVALVTRSGGDPAPVQRAAARVGPVQPTAALPVPQTAVPRTAVPPQRALPTLRPTAPRDDPQPVQRRVDVVPSAPVPASAPEPAPAPEPQKQGPPGQRELDELARRLYGPLSRRIKAELRIDRERAGQFNPG